MIKYGSDQTTARDLNVEMVFKLLQKEHLSNTDLASKMKLSKPGIAKIINEMLDNNWIVPVEQDMDDTKASVGRRKVLYRINPKAGMIAVVNFAPTHVKNALYDLEGKLIDEVDILNKEFIDRDTLHLVAVKLKELLTKHENEDRLLISACIAAPGKINRMTQELYQSPKFRLPKDISLISYFEDLFNVSFELKNDINLWLLGEREEGYISPEIEDAILLHIDTGIGGAILNKGKIVEGEYGFAAEFGLLKTFDRFGNIIYYDSLCSTNSLKNQVFYYKTLGEITTIKDDFRTKDLIQSFNNNDPLVKTVVLESAKHIGMLINNLYNIFDFRNFYISGRVRGFGEKYLNEVINSLDEKVNDLNLKYTESGDESISAGAKSVALTRAFNKLIEHRKNNGN